MATDVSTQRVDVLAKDIFIAALQSGQILLKGADAEKRGEELAKSYMALFKGIKSPPSA